MAGIFMLVEGTKGWSPHFPFSINERLKIFPKNSVNWLVSCVFSQKDTNFEVILNCCCSLALFLWGSRSRGKSKV